MWIDDDGHFVQSNADLNNYMCAWLSKHIYHRIKYTKMYMPHDKRLIKYEIISWFWLAMEVFLFFSIISHKNQINCQTIVRKIFSQSLFSNWKYLISSVDRMLAVKSQFINSPRYRNFMFSISFGKGERNKNNKQKNYLLKCCYL